MSIENKIAEMVAMAHAQNKTLSIETQNLFEVEGSYCVLASVTTDKGPFRDWAVVRPTDPTDPASLADALETAKLKATCSTLLLALDLNEPVEEEVEEEVVEIEESEEQFVSIPNIVDDAPLSLISTPPPSAGDCARCGNPILAYQTSASVTPAEQVALLTNKKWGKPMCWKCSKEKTKEYFSPQEEAA